MTGRPAAAILTEPVVEDHLIAQRIAGGCYRFANFRL